MMSEAAVIKLKMDDDESVHVAHNILWICCVEKTVQIQFLTPKLFPGQ